MSEVITSPATSLITLLKEAGTPVRSSAALEQLINQDFPAIKEEEYKYFPIRRFIEKNWDWTEKINTSGNSDWKNPISINSNKIVFNNGKLDKKASNFDITEYSIEEIGLTPERIIESNDAFSLLNESLFTDGIRITIAKGKQIETPLEIIYLHSNSSEQCVSIPRVEISVGELASFTFIEHFHFSGQHSAMVYPSVSISVGKGGRCESYTLQTSGNSQIQVNNTFVVQQRDSYYKNHTISFAGKFVRNNHQVAHEDENCETHLYGLTLGQKDTLIDHHTIVDHRKPNCYSNELYKGIYKENSVGVFNGRIYVRPNAQQTNAFQSNNNILLSDQATIHTKPQLEIWADDVKCSHGCTTGQLDLEALFYLRTRGLDEVQAKNLMVKAFASEILNNINIPELEEHVHQLIEELL